MTTPPQPGWWQASDGQWYPPELHPSVQQAPQPFPPPQSFPPLQQGPLPPQFPPPQPHQRLQTNQFPQTPPTAPPMQPGFAPGQAGLYGPQATQYPTLSAWGPPGMGGEPHQFVGKPGARRTRLWAIILSIAALALVIVGLGIIVASSSTKPTRETGTTKFSTPDGTYTITFPLHAKVQTTTFQNEGMAYYVTNANDTAGYVLAIIKPKRPANIPSDITTALVERYVIDDFTTSSVAQNFAKTFGATDFQFHDGAFGVYEGAYFDAHDTGGGVIPGVSAAHMSAVMFPVGTEIIFIGSLDEPAAQESKFQNSFSTTIASNPYDLASTPNLTITHDLAQRDGA